MIFRPSFKRPPDTPECSHEWKTGKKTIKPEEIDNPKFRERGYAATYKVRYCTKCKAVEYLDYKVN